MKVSQEAYEKHKEYHKQRYDRSNMVLYKGELKTLQDYVYSHGYESLNKFYRDAIIEKLRAMGAPADVLRKW